MSTRPFLKPYQVITDNDMSADFTSAVTNIQQISHVSYSITWITSDAVGTFSVEVSNDYAISADGTVLNEGTWTAIDLSTTVATAGTDDNAFIDIQSLSAVWCRLKYTFTSGSGELNAYVAGKVA